MEGLKDVAKGEVSQLKREVDSLDDFEHLGHDSSPLNEVKNIASDLLGSNTDVQAPARDVKAEIDKRVETVGSNITDSFDPFKNLSAKPVVSQKMDSNLLAMGEKFPDRKEVDAKMNKFLEEFSSAPKPVQESADKYNIKSFMDYERGFIQEAPKTQSNNDLLDRFSDSEPEDDYKPSKYEDFPKKQELPESFGSTENLKHETFKDVNDSQVQLPKKEYLAEKPTAPVPEEPSMEKIILPETVTEKIAAPIPEPPHSVKEKTPEPIKESIPEPPKEKAPEPPKQLAATAAPAKKIEDKVFEKKPKIAPADAEAIFRKMGLDTWFNPERLNPKVESLIYWRDPKKSGPVFGGVLLVLLALTYFSFISVVAYLSLLGLSVTIAFRIYKNIVQAVQKTGDGHPFKDLLDMDVSLPQDKVKEVSEVAVAHINAAVVELRRLFLVEDLVDSIKFGVLLWTLTYLGAWFNGMTLIIIAWVALFTLPKVYETNKTQIDANLEIVRTKLAEITSKVKAAIPIGKKAEEKKEQ